MPYEDRLVGKEAEDLDDITFGPPRNRGNEKPRIPEPDWDIEAEAGFEEVTDEGAVPERRGRRRRGRRRGIAGRDATAPDAGARESGSREPSAREPSVREPSVREPSVREPSSRELGTRESGGRGSSSRDSGSRDSSARSDGSEGRSAGRSSSSKEKRAKREVYSRGDEDVETGFDAEFVDDENIELDQPVAESSPAQGRNRRRRRRGGRRPDGSSAPSAGDVDSDELDLSEGYNLPGLLADEIEASEDEEALGHDKIPTWEETVGILVAINIDARHRPDQGRGGGNRQGGQGGGGQGGGQHGGGRGRGGNRPPNRR